MKNKYFSFVALAAAALATSCASDDLAEQKQEQTGTRTVTLTASVNEGQTRVGMTKNTDGKTASFYWHKNDQIFVQTKNGESYTGTAFSITGDDAKDGDPNATFTGEVTGTVGSYAVYPYNESHSFTGETALTYNLPASYTYTSVETNIFSKTTDGTTAYPSNPTNMPMLGTISDKSISFKCLGGLAVIRIDQMPAAEGTLTVSANEKLSGSFTVSDLSAGTPELATTSTDVTDADKKVTFNFSGATAKGVGVFYLPLATGSYTNVKVTIKDSSSETWRTFNYSGTLSITRAGVTAVPIVSANMGTIVKDDNGTYTINNKYKFVDLGLSVLWATKNIGADSEADYGDFYSWGETATKTDYSSNNYNYKDNPTTLPAAKDAATVNWGAPCRMPTQAEFTALKDKCTWKWICKYVPATGTSVTLTYGREATGNGNSIFLPASGYKTGTSVTGQGQSDGQGLYWSSSSLGMASYSYAYLLKFTNTELSCPVIECYTGCTVRAVVDKP